MVGETKDLRKKIVSSLYKVNKSAGAYGEYRNTFNIYAALSVFRKTAWPCFVMSD